MMFFFKLRNISRVFCFRLDDINNVIKVCVFIVFFIGEVM